MANTRRSKAALLALVDITGSGGTSGQDLLDMLVSILGGYASLKTVDGVTAQGGIGVVPIKLTTWVVNGDSNGLTPDHTLDQIAIDIDGVYHVNCTMSFSGSGNSTFEIHLRVNGVEADEGLHRKLSTGGDVGDAGFSGALSLLANDILTVWVESDDAGTADSITPADAQFVVNQIA